jgi:hypothetical protein
MVEPETSGVGFKSTPLGQNSMFLSSFAEFVTELWSQQQSPSACAWGREITSKFQKLIEHS